jgi:regulator of protease activity HflC (stomatin/prohibitin superfamily)
MSAREREARKAFQKAEAEAQAEKTRDEVLARALREAEGHG